MVDGGVRLFSIAHGIEPMHQVVGVVIVRAERIGSPRAPATRTISASSRAGPMVGGAV